MCRVLQLRTLLLAPLTCLVLLAAGQPLPSQSGATPGDKPGKPEVAGQKPAAPAYKYSGPFTHGNLTVFLIHGEDRLKGKQFLILSEALAQKKFVIHETKSVNELQMENLSTTDEVLILAGDILKGGQQDRVARYDLVVPPKSGKVALPVNCVERTAGRWMRSWKEGDKTFHANFDVLNTKALRLANSAKMSQGEVWEEVSNAQMKLEKKLGRDVKAKESDSSLQLTLKAKAVSEAADKFSAALQPLPRDKTDVIGYAFAINGKVYGVDVYGSPTLFKKVWPRLIRASAIEAVMEAEKDKKFAAVDVAAVQKFLADGDQGKVTTSDISGLRRVQQDGRTNCQIETLDRKGVQLRKTNIAY